MPYVHDISLPPADSAQDSARAVVSLSAPGLTQPALFVSLLEQAVAVRTIAVTLKSVCSVPSKIQYKIHRFS